MADSSPLTLEQALTAYRTGNHDAARTALESLPEPDPLALALLALCRVRQVLDRHPPGLAVDGPGLLLHLSVPFPDARLETDRQFARGWLSWLTEDLEQAERHLDTCCRQAQALDPAADPTEAACWLARVQLRLRRAGAVANFETVMRRRGGAPRVTCWYVDLLWRSSQVERAEQVWKAVRGSRKIAGIDEASLLEAHMLLRHGEVVRAERVLTEANPQGGVVQVERQLLRAWILSGRQQVELADSVLQQAEAGPYPASVLRRWRNLFNRRHGRDAEPLAPPDNSAPLLAHWLRGQEARLANQQEEAVKAYREAAAGPELRPFARYGLACLGQDDFTQLLAAQPGLFLAVRCRAQLLAERFRLREVTAGEALNVLDQATRLGYRNPAVAHFRSLALLLCGQPQAGDLREFTRVAPDQPPAVGANRLRAALEIAAHRLAPAEALELVADWSEREPLLHDPALRQAVGEQLLRLLMLTTPPRPQDPGPRSRAETMLARAERLLGNQPRLQLARLWLHPPQGDMQVLAADGDPLTRTWQRACEVVDDRADRDWDLWRQDVTGLRISIRLRHLAQALLVQEAGRRGDLADLLRLLQETDCWKAFSSPPEFVARVIESVDTEMPAWRRGVAHWLQLWEPARLGPAARRLALWAGVVPLDPETVEAPPGMPLVPWLLHQAAQALGGGETIEALHFVRRALHEDAELREAGVQAEIVRKALPELERKAWAQALARAARFLPEQPPLAPELLAGAAELLHEDPVGQTVLAGALRGDLAGARAALVRLAQRADVPSRLAHHLALLFHRAALYAEDQGQAELADRCWRLAWPCWLRRLGADAEGGAVGSRERQFLARLLDMHRRSINDFLSRNEIEAARRHWGYVEALASRAGELSECVERFRADLATDYLTATREVLRTGTAAEGWRADYEKGLGYLRRLLSLDRDNVRLLTALVEICVDWFLDCYNNEDPRTLWEQVERFTPFALKLARLIEQRPYDQAAREALANFYKYRGFIAADPAEKIALYSEARRLDPDNDNVRQLLAEVELNLEIEPE